MLYLDDEQYRFSMIMDDLEDFEQKRRDFEIWRKANKSYFVKLEDLRKQFLRRFPQDKLGDLHIDLYVEGKGNKDSFCNWLENRLVELGSIGGATAFKFGIYYGKTKKDPTVTYRFAARFGSSAEAAFDRIKQEIVALLSAGKAKNIDAIQNNMLSSMFKGKFCQSTIRMTTSTFFPGNIWSFTFSSYQFRLRKTTTTRYFGKSLSTLKTTIR